MGYPTPRTAKGQGRDILERLDILEARQWAAPQRLAAVLSSVDDADFVVGAGWFWVGTGTLNNPTPGQNYIVEQYELDSTTRYQQAHRIGAPASQIFAERWTRTRTATGVWTAWKLLSLPTTNFAPVPGAGGLVIGNGSLSGTYSVADGMLTGRIVGSLGSTSSVGGDITFEHPPLPYTGSTMSAGLARLTDSSAGTAYPATVLVNTTRVYARPMGTTAAASGTLFTREIVGSATSPFAWATGDSIVLDFEYPIL